MGKRGLPKKSCNLCRSRKVKCDRERSSTGTCTFCAERNAVCILEEEATRAKANQAAAVPTSDPDENTSSTLYTPASSSTNRVNVQRQCSCPDIFHRYDCSASLAGTAQEQVIWNNGDYFAEILAASLPVPAVFDHSSLSPPLSNLSSGLVSVVSQNVPQRAPRAGLFEVDGLTRSLLDQSVSAFFSYVNPYLPILEGAHFWPRYRAYFAQYSATNGREDDVSEDPISILLILATAVKGIGHTHIPNKFDLYTRLPKRFLYQCTDTNSLAEDGLDALEALLLFHSEETPTPDMNRPLSIHPLETEVLIKLGKVCKVNDSCHDRETATRRAVISTMTIVYDALSMRKGSLYLIKDEDIDAEISSVEYLSEDKATWL